MIWDSTKSDSFTNIIYKEDQESDYSYRYNVQGSGYATPCFSGERKAKKYKRSRPYKDVNNTELFIVSNNKIASLGRSKENKKSNREESINFYRRNPSTKCKF